jgi:hypothetical protein
MVRFRADCGRSALAVGTALDAPYLPFAILVGIGSVGWTAVLHLDASGGGPRRLQTFPPSPASFPMRKLRKTGALDQDGNLIIILRLPPVTGKGRN